MRILVSGSTGLVGSALVSLLESQGHQAVRLLRSGLEAKDSGLVWDPANAIQDTLGWDGLDAIVHLAGESIAAGRWTPLKKAKIRDSRVVGTRNLCEMVASLDEPPKVLVCASAIGYYGDRASQVLTEESPSGKGFLAEVCRDWEAAVEAATKKGIRVVHSRTGVVLSASGGALTKMLTPFKMGFGGVVGGGRQYMSWIALDDMVSAIAHVINTETIEGPVNMVAPNPVTNYEFTKTLGRVLGRPTIFPVPAFAARLAFGEMADELLLSSARISCAKLLASGYQFKFSKLEDALKYLLNR